MFTFYPAIVCSFHFVNVLHIQARIQTKTGICTLGVIYTLNPSGNLLQVGHGFPARAHVVANDKAL